MGDLLKTMRSSQIFSVTGLPDVRITTAPPEEKGGPQRYQVELRGLDVFDPTDDGGDATAPAAMSQPGSWTRTTTRCASSSHRRSSHGLARGRALRSHWVASSRTASGSTWPGTRSAPFEPGEQRKVAVKVIDDRGNELLVVKSLDEAS